jgi:tetratricopeptide (TPR) repeat protein
VAAYDRAIKIDPQSALAWCNHCNALINQSEYDLALSSAEKAIKIDPEMAEANSCKRAAQMGLGSLDEADSALAEAEEAGSSR